MCEFCNKKCKSQSGLSQHISRTKACQLAQREAAGCRTRVPEETPEKDKRRSKRIKKSKEKAKEPEPIWLPVDDEPDEEGGVLSENEGLVADTEDLEEEMADEEESDDGDGCRSVDSSDTETQPNREKLEQFRLCCEDMSRIMGLSRAKKCCIKLMDTLKRKKAPLNAYQELLEWHLRETGEMAEHETIGDIPNYKHRAPLLKELYERYNVENMKPKIKKVKLPSSKAVVFIPYRNAADSIVSLLTDPRITDEDYLFHGDSPWCSPPDNITHISDLNTGEAYLKTHAQLVNKKNQVLVLVPMYIDGATTGQFSDLPVTPLKIGLGIHKRTTREKEYAWRTIGWLPTVRKSTSRGKAIFKESGHMEAEDFVVMDGEGSTECVDDVCDMEESDGEVEDLGEVDEDTEVKAQDFHTMIHAILEASGFLELQRTGLIFDLVFKNRCYRDSELIFRVPYVKCDTEEGDLNSGKYTSRYKYVKHGCRYCHCPMDDLDDPLAKHRPKTQKQTSKLVESSDLEGLQAISQQHINNAWYKVKFHVANDFGIHGACPSEKLHAVLLGIFRYVRDTFFEFVGADSQLAEDINGLAKVYGKYLTHQSEKDFPTTNFSKGLCQGKMMATQYRGVLLLMAAVLRSWSGKKMLRKWLRFHDGSTGNWSYLVELLLGWESFLCEERIDMSVVKRLEKKHRYLMYQIQKVAHRTKGMGLKLMKYHAIIHLTNDIKLYGVPKEVCTGPNESHHKPAKQAAKTTQRNESTFLEQVGTRLTEYLVIALAMEEVENEGRVWTYFQDSVDVYWDALVVDPDATCQSNENLVEEPEGAGTEKEAVVTTGGTRILIHRNRDESPSFKVLGKSKSASKTVWLDQVVLFLNQLQDAVTDYIPDELEVYTEHKRDNVRWRAHPNYHGNGQWKDWVLVDWGDYGISPAHIWCFVDLSSYDSGTNKVEFGGIYVKSGVYAVVECAEYDQDEEVIAESDIFKPVTLEIEGVETREDGKKVTIRKFYLADCEAFHGPCSVVPDLGGPRNSYFQVQPRREWSSNFVEWVKEPHNLDLIDAALLQDMKEAAEEKRREKAERRRKAAEKRANIQE